VDPALGYVVVAVAGAALCWVMVHLHLGTWARATDAAGLVVHTENDPTLVAAGAAGSFRASFVMPRDDVASALPPPGGRRQWRAWLRPLGAYDGGATDVRVSVWGSSPATVVIDGLLIQVVERTDPTGHVLQSPAGGAGAPTRSLRVDLDVEPCVVDYHDDLGNLVEPFVITLSPGDVEVFRITASTTRRCRWTAELHVVVNGERRTAHLDDGGQPFRTCGTDGLPTSVWSVRQQTWLTRPTRGSR
jgi:hypothetical protein